MLKAFFWANEGLRFLLELIMFFGYGYWGFHMTDNTVFRWVLAFVIPSLAIIFWAIFMAPTSSHHVSLLPYIIFETLLFGAVSLGIGWLGYTQVAIIFFIIFAGNAIYLHIAEH
jgi:hypothetical protein